MTFRRLANPHTRLLLLSSTLKHTSPHGSIPSNAPRAAMPVASWRRFHKRRVVSREQLAKRHGQSGCRASPYTSAWCAAHTCRHVQLRMSQARMVASQLPVECRREHMKDDEKTGCVRAKPTCDGAPCGGYLFGSLGKGGGMCICACPPCAPVSTSHAISVCQQRARTSLACP